MILTPERDEAGITLPDFSGPRFFVANTNTPPSRRVVMKVAIVLPATEDSKSRLNMTPPSVPSRNPMTFIKMAQAAVSSMFRFLLRQSIIVIARVRRVSRSSSLIPSFPRLNAVNAWAKAKPVTIQKLALLILNPVPVFIVSVL